MNNNTVRLRFGDELDFHKALCAIPLGYWHWKEDKGIWVIEYYDCPSPYPKEPEPCKHNWFEVFRTSHISQYRCTVCNELKTETY
jgi:hypothetical protein